jgi:hypothetical protein
MRDKAELLLFLLLGMLAFSPLAYLLFSFHWCVAPP